MSRTLSKGKKRKRTSTGRHLLFALVFLAVVALDQLAKAIVRHSFQFTRNTGAAFGIFRGNAVLISWVSVVIIGLILFFYDRIPDSKLALASVALILGGVAGNLIDRVCRGYVTDFISIWIWPSFNIADSAASIGVALLLFYIIKKK